jgi:hypothetical protein
VNFPDRDRHVDQHGYGYEAGEQAGDDQNASEKFCSREQVGGPSRESDMLHHVVNMGESAEHFGVPMRDHDGADYKPQNEQG